MASNHMKLVSFRNQLICVYEMKHFLTCMVDAVTTEECFCQVKCTRSALHLSFSSYFPVIVSQKAAIFGNHFR